QLLGVAPGADASARDPLGDAFTGGCFVERFGRLSSRRLFVTAHRAAATRAAKIAGSLGLMAYSGCHCTPRQKRWRGDSIASITPSGARALTTTPSGSSFAA